MTQSEPQSQTFLTIAGQKQSLDQFAELVRWRAQQQSELPRDQQERDRQLQAAFDAERGRLTSQFKAEYAQLEADFEKAKSDAEHQYDNENYIIASEQQEATDVITRHFTKEDAVARDAKHHAQHKAAGEFERNKKEPIAQFTAVKQLCAVQKQAVDTLTAEAVQLLRTRRINPPDSNQPSDLETEDDAEIPGTGGSQPLDDPQQAFSEAMVRGREAITRNEHLLSARFIYEGWPVILMIFLPIIGFCVAAFVLQFSWTNVFLLGIGGGLLAAIVGSALIYPIARGRTVAVFRQFQREMDQANAANRAIYGEGKRKFEPVYNELVQTRDKKLHDAHDERTKIKQRLTADRDGKLNAANAEFGERFAAIKSRRGEQLAAAESHYPPAMEKLRSEHDEALKALSQQLEKDLAASQQQFDTAWEALVSKWHGGVNKFQEVIDATGEFCRQRVGDWNEIDWTNWKPAGDAPQAVRFGQFHLHVHDFGTDDAPGVPEHPDLQIDRTEYDLPALLTFPECPSLLLEADGDARDDAVLAMQNVMLRLLATLPPGKVRFTIVDPTGRGQNFSAFMHLADFDEQLVTNRIWTESSHINKRLVDVTEHMENVIQKYLRNEFESIQQYNLHAWEGAEPDRVLVGANYPANFTEEAAGRLISIASSGPRCGVSTLMSVDTKLAAERKFDLGDLEATAVTLKHDGHKFTQADQQLGRFPLTLDNPPDDATFTEAVRTIGKAAEDSSRVEVPFASVLPEDDAWWQADSRSGIDVALGRAGATKLQHMRLGKGTSQHVLMAGKTGSGKSTLLNALITNRAASYGYDEFEFYLIDFKKGF